MNIILQHVFERRELYKTYPRSSWGQKSIGLFKLNVKNMVIYILIFFNDDFIYLIMTHNSKNLSIQLDFV